MTKSRNQSNFGPLVPMMSTNEELPVEERRNLLYVKSEKLCIALLKGGQAVRSIQPRQVGDAFLRLQSPRHFLSLFPVISLRPNAHPVTPFAGKPDHLRSRVFA